MEHLVVPEAVRAEIVRRLDDVERQFDVRVLYAVESGSRAWGFASQDSDFDVRFLYVQKREWYLSIDAATQRDVIELPLEDVWDINGWDLPKALRLFRKSNPSLLEWLQSPIIYREAGPLAARLRTMLESSFSPRACMYHYLSMAENNFDKYLCGAEVSSKKYLYALRPMLACYWLEAERGPVPVEFAKLLAAVELPADVRHAIDALVARKQAGGEMEVGPRDPVLHAFLERQFARYEQQGVRLHDAQPSTTELNELFLSQL